MCRYFIAGLRIRSGMARAIITCEKMRPSRRTNGNTRANKEGKDTNLVDFLTDVTQHFSLVLCDEAHKTRNRETQTYNGADIVMRCAAVAFSLAPQHII